MPRTTILEYLDNFRHHAGETAYVYRRGYRAQHWSYGDVLISAYRFARELDSRGIGSGDKVLLWERTARSGWLPSSAVYCAGQLLFPSITLPPRTLPIAWRSK